MGDGNNSSWEFRENWSKSNAEPDETQDWPQSSNDIAIFNNTSNHPVTLAASNNTMNLGGLTVTSDYTNTITLSRNVQVIVAAVGGGTVQISADKSLSLHDATWTGGTFSGPGSVVVTDDLAISGSADKTVDGAIFTSDELANWTGSGDISITNDGRIYNYGTFNISADLPTISGNHNNLQNGLGQFVNSGTMNSNPASGATEILSTMSNLGSTNISAGNFGVYRPSVSVANYVIADGCYLFSAKAALPIPCINWQGALLGMARRSSLQVPWSNSWPART